MHRDLQTVVSLGHSSLNDCKHVLELEIIASLSFVEGGHDVMAAAS